MPLNKINDDSYLAPAGIRDEISKRSAGWAASQGKEHSQKLRPNAATIT